MAVDQMSRHDVPGDEVVVACTLGEADLAAQSKRWHELRRRSEAGQLVTQSGKRVYFRADDGVLEKLNALVAIERRCCSWADWTISAAQDEVVLEVASTDHGIEAVHQMFTPDVDTEPCCDNCG